jgi:GT2 family glycosyltransferase
MNDSIAAIIVTFNRKKLLLECIDSICNQSKKPNAIFIIDNNSSDGTALELMEKNYILNSELPNIQKENRTENVTIQNNSHNSEITIFYTLKFENDGSSGGFNLGLKLAYSLGFEWVWVMDDDTIPTKTALEILSEKKSIIPNIGFLSSKVLWRNDEIHLMNMVCPNPFINGIAFNKYSTHNIYLIPSCSFVSMLISRQAISTVGLPIKEFYIWLDDIEYSRRIIKHNFLGFYVDQSIVYHKTLENYEASIQSSPLNTKWKFYYGLRNSIFLLRKSNSTFKIPIKIVLQFCSHINEVFKRESNKWEYFKIIIKAYWAGMFFSPRIEKIN